MPSLVAKFQKCGRRNCRCHISSALHGPYLWLVSYVRASANGGKGKYSWKYLGKSSQLAYEKLRELNPEIANNLPISTIQERLNKVNREARSEILISAKKSLSRKILQIEAFPRNPQ